MSATHPDSVCITQSANGYVLMPTFSDHVRAVDSSYVFPSKAALFAHLAKHFTHEAVSVPMDAEPPTAGTIVIGVAEHRTPPPVEPGDLGYVSGQGFTDFNRRPT